jgi:hypothetical protein
MQTQKLLSRDEFREAVKARDGHRCVRCGRREDEVRLDAHHIIERRLWPDGGYYVDNGATLCDNGTDTSCHMLAEKTELTVEKIRELAGITRKIVPPHMYGDVVYDKWGNVVLPNGTRMKGELFNDESVQKVIKGVLHEFTPYVKYPRTYHLPWSPGIGKDDRVVEYVKNPWTKRPDGMGLPIDGMAVVVTEKMDGENTTMYRDYIHARSIDGRNHPSRNWVKGLHARIKHEIPDGWRICGENLYAKHSILYTELPSYFIMFSIWNERNVCLGWEETKEWAALLELPTPRELYVGMFSESIIKPLMIPDKEPEGVEGYVVRSYTDFPYAQFRFKVAKYVRRNHVQTHGHWMREVMQLNQIKSD